MKKIVSGLLFFFLLAQIGVAKENEVDKKEIEVNWGISNKFGKNFRNQQVIGETNDFIFSFNLRGRSLSRKQEFSFYKYEKKSFKILKSTTFKLPKRKGSVLSFKKAFMVENQIVFFYESYNKDTKKTVLLVQKISQDGKVDNKVLELGSLSFPERKKGNFWSRKAGSFSVILNDQRNKFTVFKNAPRAEKNAKEKVHLAVYNGGIKKEWGSDFEIPYTDKNFVIYKTMIDEKGNAYILGKKYDEVKKVKDNGKVKIKRKWSLFSKDVGYEFALLYYNKDTKKVKTYTIDLANKHIVDIDLKVNDAESIVCAGFYFPKGLQWTPNIKGTFFARINRETGELTSNSVKDFDKKFLETIRDGKVYSFYWTQLGLMWKELARGKGVTKKGGLKNFRMRDFEVRKDGSAVIIGEGYRVVEMRSEDSNGNTKINYFYYYDDIIVINVEKNGEISWYKRIPKKQVSKNDGGYYSSYHMKLDGDNVYFVFNDRKSNNKRLKQGKNAVYMKFPRRSSTTLVTVDRKGNIERESLFKNKDMRLVLVPKQTRNYQNYNSDISIMFGLNYRWYHIFGGATFKYGSLKL
jgi:hypothetical protein